jgi:hypothetical protein
MDRGTADCRIEYIVAERRMTRRPRMLAEACFPRLGRVECEVAILPWGATEPHKHHLPFGSNAQQLATPLTLNLAPGAQARVLRDTVDRLAHH